MAHSFDNDGLCTRCGLDGAEVADERRRFVLEWGTYHPGEPCPESEKPPWPPCIPDEAQAELFQ